MCSGGSLTLFRRKGFPHSDICGSTLGRQLPATFRSHPRPSSALDAKASTVDSLYLGEQRCSCSLCNSQRANAVPPCSYEHRPDTQTSLPIFVWLRTLHPVMNRYVAFRRRNDGRCLKDCSHHFTGGRAPSKRNRDSQEVMALK